MESCLGMAGSGARGSNTDRQMPDGFSGRSGGPNRPAALPAQAIITPVVWANLMGDETDLVGIWNLVILNTGSQGLVRRRPDQFSFGFWGLHGGALVQGFGRVHGAGRGPESCLWAFGLSCGLFLSRPPPVLPVSVISQQLLLPRPPAPPTSNLVANYVSFAFTADLASAFSPSSASTWSSAVIIAGSARAFLCSLQLLPEASH